MSRERPAELSRTVPNQADVRKAAAKREERQKRQREEVKRLKALHGSAFLAGIFNPMNRGTMRAPQFIRRSYEANILDELNDFYARRPRPWRQKHRQAGATRKESVKVRRRDEWALSTYDKTYAELLAEVRGYRAALLNSKAKVVIDA